MNERGGTGESRSSERTTRRGRRLRPRPVPSLHPFSLSQSLPLLTLQPRSSPCTRLRAPGGPPAGRTGRVGRPFVRGSAQWRRLAAHSQRFRAAPSSALSRRRCGRTRRSGSLARSQARERRAAGCREGRARGGEAHAADREVKSERVNARPSHPRSSHVLALLSLPFFNLRASRGERAQQDGAPPPPSSSHTQTRGAHTSYTHTSSIKIRPTQPQPAGAPARQKSPPSAAPGAHTAPSTPAAGRRAPRTAQWPPRTRPRRRASPAGNT